MVRIHPDPPTERSRGHSSAGRAPALQAGGHRFDPGWLHQVFQSASLSDHVQRCIFCRLFFNNPEEVKRIRFRTWNRIYWV